MICPRLRLESSIGNRKDWSFSIWIRVDEFGSVIDLIGTYWDFYAANFATDHVLGKTEAGTQEECQTSMVSSTT